MKNILVITLVVCSTFVVFADEKKPKKVEIPAKYTSHRVESEIGEDLFTAKNTLSKKCEEFIKTLPKNNPTDDFSYTVDLTSDDGNTLGGICTVYGPNESARND